LSSRSPKDPFSIATVNCLDIIMARSLRGSGLFSCCLKIGLFLLGGVGGGMSIHFGIGGGGPRNCVLLLVRTILLLRCWDSEVNRTDISLLTSCQWGDFNVPESWWVRVCIDGIVVAVSVSLFSPSENSLECCRGRGPDEWIVWCWFMWCWFMVWLRSSVADWTIVSFSYPFVSIHVSQCRFGLKFVVISESRPANVFCSSRKIFRHIQIHRKDTRD